MDIKTCKLLGRDGPTVSVPLRRYEFESRWSKQSFSKRMVFETSNEAGLEPYFFEDNKKSASKWKQYIEVRKHI